jgi:hypothetical protein
VLQQFRGRRAMANLSLSIDNVAVLRCAQIVSSEAMVKRSEIEDDAQCRIDAAHLVEAEQPDALAEPARLNCLPE